LLLALNAFHIRYSQEARGYSLLVLLITLSAYFLVRLLESPNNRNRRTYLAVTVLAFYAHFFAVLVIAAQFVALFFDRERSRAVRPARLLAWMSVWFLPGLLFLLIKNQGQLDWIPPLRLSTLFGSLTLFAGQGGLWPLLAFAAATGWALISSRRPSSSGDRENFSLRLIAVWLLLPIGLLLLASSVKPLFLSRFLTMCLPALVLLAGAGLQRLKLPVRMGAVALVIVLSLLGARNYYTGLPAEGEQWRELTHFVVSNSVAGDGLIFDNGIARPVFEHYRREAKWPQILFPAHGSQLTYRDFEGIATPQLIASVSQTSPRVWLVTRIASPALEQALAENFSKTDQRDFRGARVQLYVRRQS
jgi:mannosyltransferase